MTNFTTFKHIIHHNKITVINPNEIAFYIFCIKAINLLLQVYVLWDFNKNFHTFFFYLHSFRRFILCLTSEMNLQLYPQLFMCTEWLQTLFASLGLLVLFTFYTDLISGLWEYSFLLQNPLPSCQVPAACNRHCFQPTSLCPTPKLTHLNYGLWTCTWLITPKSSASFDCTLADKVNYLPPVNVNMLGVVFYNEQGIF